MKLAVFDVDGTLVDSVALLVETITVSFTALGQAVPEEALMRSISGLNLERAISILAPGADAERLAALAAEYRREYLARATAEMREPLFPGTEAALATLAARDDMLMAVATGKALRGANRILQAHAIDTYFTSVQTPDHNPSKPHPDMIFAAMKTAGSDSAGTVMIGDTNHDMEMARAAGVRAIGVSWGYHLPADLLKAGADIIIDDYNDLPGAIDTLLGT